MQDYRIGVTAEICFSITSRKKLSKKALNAKVRAAIIAILDSEDGINLDELEAGRLYPDSDPGELRLVPDTAITVYDGELA